MIPIWQIVVMWILGTFGLGLFWTLWSDFRFGERQRRKHLAKGPKKNCG